MGISDRIETFIIELLKDENGWIEVGRNELASIFKCVPSQINYVISTRFSPEKGYLVESRRGGGGYLKIRRIAVDDEISHVVSQIGEKIDFAGMKVLIQYLYINDRMEERMGKMILSGLSDKSLVAAGAEKDKVRAEILKNMLLM